MLGFIISLIVIGLIAGALGRLIVPGPDPMGIIPTILLGIGGSFLGGLVGRLLFGETYAPGIIMSTLGAALLVLLYRRFVRNRATTRRRL